MQLPIDVGDGSIRYAIDSWEWQRVEMFADRPLAAKFRWIAVVLSAGNRGGG